MPLRGGWYLKGWVNITQFKGDVTDEEFLTGANHPDLIPSMEKTPHPLTHFIFEMVDNKLDRQMPSLKIAQQSPLAKHRKLGWVILVNYRLNPFNNMIIVILSQMFNIRYRFMATRAEAIAFLREVDSTLPEFPPEDQIEWFNFVNWTADGR